MAQVAIKEIDLTQMLNQITQINSKLNVFDKVFSKIDNNFGKITQSTQKFNQNITNTNRQSKQLHTTFQKVQGVIRMIAMTPIGKGLFNTNIGGMISGAVNYVKSATDGTLSDVALAKGSNTSVYNLRSFDRSADLSGVGDILNKGMMRNFRERMSDVSMAGNMALLERLHGKTRDEFLAMDTTDAFVKSIGLIQKKIEEIGGFDSFAGSELGKQYAEALGLSLGDLRSITSSRFASDYQEQKAQGANIGMNAKFERQVKRMEYSFTDLRDNLLQALLPSLTEFAKKLQQVAKDMTKWLIDNKVMQKIGEGLGKITNKLLNFKFEDITEFLGNTLPRMFYKLGSVMAYVMGKFTTGDESKEYYKTYARLQGKGKGLSDEVLNEFEKEGIAIGKHKESQLVGNALADYMIKRIDSYVNIKLETPEGLQAKVTKQTGNAVLAGGVR